MINNDQDSSIISSLVVKKEVTAYSISKDIGISVPQVQYRLDKLLKCGIIKSRKLDGKTLYYVHPALKSKAAMESIVLYIKAIVDVIDDIERLSPNGMKMLLSFIISKTKILDDLEDTEAVEPKVEVLNEDKLIQDFKNDIMTYANEHKLKILNIKGWTDKKIRWMALNDRKCACKPDERKCPCPEGLVEVKTEKDRSCLCSLFGA